MTLQNYPNAALAPTREYRTWLVDSRRWQQYKPRVGDVSVATYPKSGTTWILRIVSLLVFKKTDPIPLDATFPWWEYRVALPVETIAERFESRTHQRCTKTHLPFDGLPIFDELRYIHCARDPRDVCLSYHNHTNGFTADALHVMDQVGLKDETIGHPYPRVEKDPANFFHRWLTEGALPGQSDGLPFLSYFEFEKTYYQNRHRKNLLFVHYNDMKADLVGEMLRIAQFIGVSTTRAEVEHLAEAAQFSTMRRDGAALIPDIVKNFDGGAQRLFHQGNNERWKSAFREDDINLLDDKLKQSLPADYVKWIFKGRGSGIDPKAIA
jgi:aryl sulfotransferase